MGGAQLRKNSTFEPYYFWGSLQQQNKIAMSALKQMATEHYLFLKG
jgi:hypothetical protein